MRTVVYQSYRPQQIPAWIDTCLHSVKDWALGNRFEYRLFDDDFFNYAPDWFRQRAGHQICPVTDLARLVAARELLAEGFERTVWIDADVLVFAPDRLVVDTSTGFALCHELWPYTDPNGRRGVSRRVNNCVAVFHRGSVHLDFLIDAALRIADSKTRLGKLDVGTAFLTPLRSILPFELLPNVGAFGPAIVAELASGEGPHLREYAGVLTHPLACANFCASLAEGDAASAAPGLYEAATARCLATGGAVINNLIPAGPR